MLKTIEGHNDRVQSVAFSPDGLHIVSGSDDNTVRIWDVQTDTLAIVARAGIVTIIRFSE